MDVIMIDPYKVMILCQEDGYHNIAETVAGVCEFVQEGRLGVDQIDASFVSKRIASKWCICWSKTLPHTSVVVCGHHFTFNIYIH